MLVEVGLDPGSFGDPGEAFERLHARFGRRATLVDRYELEARVLGVPAAQLEGEQRARLAREVLALHYPGFEFVSGSDRARSDPVEVVPYDPRWPDAFDHWQERLSEQLPGSARIHHIGSTAVPELAAKPVIDVLVVVRDAEDEESYVPAIEHVGVALRSREPGHRYFRAAGGRPRDVQIHACGPDGEWEREHMLFRDYLRHDTSLREAYARLKLELAERYRDDRLAYNDAKTGFILDALADAEQWAERVGWALR
jgi:GrpB-like predicted nucleotidyltransferase (UPF0157 family)